MRTIPLFLGICFFLGRGPALAASQIPFPVSQSALSAELAKLQADVAKFASLPCAFSSAVAHLGAFEQGVQNTNGSLIAESKTYLELVQTPMVGNGKCDQGFEAVARESENRLQATLRIRERVNQLQKQLRAISDMQFSRPLLIFSAKSEDFSCPKESIDRNGVVAAQLGASLSSFDRARESLDFEVSRFESYRNANARLGVRCGQEDSAHGEKTVLEATPYGGTKNPALAGKSLNGASDVSGIKEDLDKLVRYPDGSGARKVESEKYPKNKEAMPAGWINGSSTAAFDASTSIGRSPASMESTITPSQEETLVFHGDLGTVRDFRAEVAAQQTIKAIPRAKVKASDAGNRSAQLGEARSLGAVVFEEPSGGSASGLSLELVPLVSGESSPAHSPVLLNGDSHSAGFYVASSESNLFQLVSAQYRNTDLFRRAKIIKVPLDAFKPNLKF